ncbi:glycosyltransferase family 8 protein [Paenibacillus sp. BAC0078]
MHRMNILVTLNSGYLKPLKVMLKSMFVNNPGEDFAIYLMHSSIGAEELEATSRFVEQEGHRLFIITVQDELFDKAPVVKHYSKEMYYRILAFRFLPAEIRTILYLDPDMIIINKIRKLYDIDLSAHMLAAASHERISLKEINRIRLLPYDITDYYNTGVLLMNLENMRQNINEAALFEFVEEYKTHLILPDQDIINALYSASILKINEVVYNYDPRFYLYYKILSGGQHDMHYVIHNSSIIHFCGKRKPWNKNYTGQFHSLYKHYEKIALS